VIELRKPIKVHDISVKKRLNSMEVALAVLYQTEENSEFKTIFIPLPIPEPWIKNEGFYYAVESVLNKVIKEINKK